MDSKGGNALCVAQASCTSRRNTPAQRLALTPLLDNMLGIGSGNLIFFLRLVRADFFFFLLVACRSLSLASKTVSSSVPLSSLILISSLTDIVLAA